MIELNMAKFNVKNPQTGEFEPLDGASQARVQSDWNQTDNSAGDFIKNKPTLGAAAEKSVDTSPTSGSENLVTSGGVYNAIQSSGDSYTKSETDTLLSGKASLVDGKVPSTQLPSYVDDVLEYSSTSVFPATGESGKIYVATDTNRTYRWGGSAYVEISESLALGETASTAYPGSKGKANADAIVAIKDGTTIDSFADVETALANIPSVTVDQTYDGTSANAQSGVAIEGKKPGLKTTGKQYTIDGQTVIAGTGAEVFNNLVNNKASGPYSHAEGAETTASGTNSHAEGAATKAFGTQSHAEGGATTASGNGSHSEGSGTVALGDNSHSEGQGTKASSANQHVQGKYNVEDTNDTYAFIIGNGTADNTRHNAFAVDWNGLIYVNGASTGVDVSAVDPALSSTSTNPVQNKAVQVPMARLIDAGAKNIFDPTVIPQTATRNGVTITRTENGIHVSGTATATADTAIANNIGLVIPSDGYRVYAKTSASNLVLWMEYKVNGSSVYCPITRDVLNAGYVLNYLYFKSLPGSASFDVDVDIMLCPAEDYAISSEFVPYAPSNRELYEEVGTKASLEDILGVGTIITNNANMDNLTSIGKWYCVNAPTAVTVTNAPFTDAAYFGWTIRSIATSDRYVQIAIKNSDDLVIAKRRYSGVWSAWSYLTGTAVT